MTDEEFEREVELLGSMDNAIRALKKEHAVLEETMRRIWAAFSERWGLNK